MSPGWASAIHWVGNNHDRYLDSSPSLQSLTLPMVFAPASHHPTMPGKRAKSSTAEPPTRTIANEKDDKTNPQKPVVITAFSVDMFQQLTFPNDPNQTPTMRTVVHIQPESIWASLPKYRNCVIRGEKYSVHQYAIVSRSQPLPKPFHPLDRDLQIPCVARILEVRAADPKNVWLRLYWLYRPEEIPGGRREYHGKDELIISNHMEIVDALQVECPVQVRRWKEEEKAEDDDDNDNRRHLPAAETREEEEALYFRQTYNFVTREVSVSKFLSLEENTKGGKVKKMPERETGRANHSPPSPSKKGPSHDLHLQPARQPRSQQQQVRNPMHQPQMPCPSPHALPATVDPRGNPPQPEGTNGSSVSPPAPPQIQFRQQHEDVVFSTSVAGKGGEHFRIETIESQRAENKGRARFCITDLWEEDHRSWEVDFQCAKCLARIL
ncbi:MAG: hypothetical protein LQ341_000734 [Variospora aurantia]|nr:MAG: hypothetical protein LQ341_000734 [Variospora aurantia]